MSELTWPLSFNELLDWMEQQRVDIKTPFTPDERSLALTIAEANHFANYQRELPARAPDIRSDEFRSYYWGIWTVCRKRGDVPDPAKFLNIT